MLELCRLSVADMDEIEPQAAQRLAPDWRRMALLAASEGPAWSARWNGRVVGVGGVALAWTGRGNAWCMLADGIPKMAWTALHRAALRCLDDMGWEAWRIEAEAKSDFAQGRRWLIMLGFSHEGTARMFGPGGEDFERFARITPWN